jgi:DNA-binding response OmpR family regulator
MNICVIEDEKSILKLIEYDLKNAGYHVTSYMDGQQASEAILTQSYDVFVVDWMLPGVSGIELVSQLRQHKSDAIIIMLTAKDEESDVLDAFEAGVDDYLSKPFSPRELLARIKAHTKRYHYKEKKILSFEDIEIHRDQRKVIVANQEQVFTKKEFDLLEYFMNNRNIVLTRDDILNHLWNFDYDGDTRIVDVHVFKLRSKLESTACTIASIRGVGYVLQKK